MNNQKAAHLAVYFIQKSGGSSSILKLIKLMYLAEREHLSNYMRTITHDHFVSMPHGPVPTGLYDLINGCIQCSEWDRLISDRENNSVSLKDLSTFNFDELSECEIGTARKVWDEFGHMGKFEIRDWTHNNCPEWEDPLGSSIPISYAKILQASGKMNAKEAKECSLEIESLQKSISSN